MNLVSWNPSFLSSVSCSVAFASFVFQVLLILIFSHFFSLLFIASGAFCGSILSLKSRKPNLNISRSLILFDVGILNEMNFVF